MNNAFFPIFVMLLSSMLGVNTVVGRLLGVEAVVYAKQRSFLDVFRAGVLLGGVMLLSGLLCGIMYLGVLQPLSLDKLAMLVFVLIGFGVVFGMELCWKRWMNESYTEKNQKILPLLYINVALFSLFLAVMEKGDTVWNFMWRGGFIGFGYMLCALVLTGLDEERMVMADIPDAFQGIPIQLITLGLMGMAFSAFSHMVF